MPRDNIEESPYVKEKIEKWEKAYNRSHIGTVELNPGQEIVYYDDVFVKDLMTYMLHQHQLIDKLSTEMQDVKNLLKEVRDGTN